MLAGGFAESHSSTNFFINIPPGLNYEMGEIKIYNTNGEKISAIILKKDSPAGRYLIGQGVPLADFNSYGSRRGNHEVMLRGTFANIRIKNKLAASKEGSFLGVGGVQVSDAEKATLADISKALSTGA